MPRQIPPPLPPKAKTYLAAFERALRMRGAVENPRLEEALAKLAYRVMNTS